MDQDFLLPSNDTAFAAQTTTYTGTAGTVTGFKPGPKRVMVWTTTDAYIKVGESVTATTASCPIPAYTPVVFGVPPGTSSTWTVSAIQVAAGGSVYVKPLG